MHWAAYTRPGDFSLASSFFGCTPNLRAVAARIPHRYRCLSSGFDEAAVTRSTFAARSRATCCSITVRVSGLAVRYRSNAPTSQRIARPGSTVTASTSAGIPLRIRAEPTKSPAIRSPRTPPSLVTRTFPRTISVTASGSLPCSISRCPTSSVVHEPMLRTWRTSAEVNSRKRAVEYLPPRASV